MQLSESGQTYGTAHLAERQMLLHHVRDRAVREVPAAELGLRYRFITISRTTGSLGLSAAQELAQQLGWRVYDKEIVNAIAENSHVRQNLVQALDERSQNLIHDSVEHLLKAAIGGSFGAEEYCEGLLKTLVYIAAKGEAILVGRGANFALASADCGLHVRLIASPEIRIERLSRRWGVSQDEARRRMLELDRERRDFVRRVFRQDPEDIRNYDMVFNTGKCSVQEVAAAILGMVRLPAPPASARFDH